MAKAQTHLQPVPDSRTVYSVLFIIGICHLLNDTLQAVIPAMFPILEGSLGLTFTQLGFITFTLNMTASVMQPVVGLYTDKYPKPYALPIGLASSMFGMLGLALSPNFPAILVSVLFIGLGSAVFHPEGSRVAFLAAGTRRGLSQSIFQVGGNGGQALAPVITALVLVPLGQFGAIWFTLIAGAAVLFLIRIARWYTGKMEPVTPTQASTTGKKTDQKTAKAIKGALFVLIFLTFARTWYVKAISNFYAFYAIENYQVSIAQAQIYLFTFLFMGAVGTFFGGPLADRFGKRTVILCSFLFPAPFSLAMPHLGPVGAIIFLGLIGFLIMASFSVTVVYAQELVPSKIGTMSGLIVGLAFGMGAIGTVILGTIIDHFGLTVTFIGISLLPLLGLLTYVLPTDEKVREWHA